MESTQKQITVNVHHLLYQVVQMGMDSVNAQEIIQDLTRLVVVVLHQQHHMCVQQEKQQQLLIHVLVQVQV